MASETESVMAVCAEWRDCIESADPSAWNDERIAWLVKTTKAQQIAYLDRIEAAWKREKSKIEANALAVGGLVEAERRRVVFSKTETTTVGNAAAMREALETIHDKVNSLDEECGVDPVEIRDIASAALSAPARQCDVGTAEEQDDRFREFCDTYRSCHKCPYIGFEGCALAWAQMPYDAQEGAAK